MSIQTSKTNAHQQRRSPKPLRKGGLHSIETTGAVYAHAFTGQYADSTLQPLDRARAFDSRMRAVQTVHTARVCNSTTRGAYPCPELAPSGRPGAMDAYRLPSGGVDEQAARARVEARRAARAPAGQMIPLRGVA